MSMKGFMILLALASVFLLSACSGEAGVPGSDILADSGGEGGGAQNGIYYGEPAAGIWLTLIISNGDNQGFHFSFVESGISGDAGFEDDGYAYYYDASGQGINFRFEGDAVLVDAGYHYMSLAAAYRSDRGGDSPDLPTERTEEIPNDPVSVMRAFVEAFNSRDKNRMRELSTENMIGGIESENCVEIFYGLDYAYVEDVIVHSEYDENSVLIRVYWRTDGRSREFIYQKGIQMWLFAKVVRENGFWKFDSIVGTSP